jgi:hypothetical protein
LLDDGLQDCDTGKEKEKTTITTTNLIVNKKTQKKEKKRIKMLGLSNDAMDAAICVLLFRGKSKDWLAWMKKFLAKAKCKNIKHIYLLDLSKNPIVMMVWQTEERPKSL